MPTESRWAREKSSPRPMDALEGGESEEIEGGFFSPRRRRRLISFNHHSIIWFNILILSLSSFSPALHASHESTAGGSEAASKANFYSNYYLHKAQEPSSLMNTTTATIQNRQLISLLHDTNHSHASDVISLDFANDAWRLLRQNALEFARTRVEMLRPSVERLVEDSRVSQGCATALSGWLDRLMKLDKWAFQMYNAYGDFPATGFVEGTHNSMGAYESCVEAQPNSIIGRPQYCSFAYQPILPKRPEYHNILAPIDHLANFTSPDEVSFLIY